MLFLLSFLSIGCVFGTNSIPINTITPADIPSQTQESDDWYHVPEQEADPLDEWYDEPEASAASSHQIAPETTGVPNHLIYCEDEVLTELLSEIVHRWARLPSERRHEEQERARDDAELARLFDEEEYLNAEARKNRDEEQQKEDEKLARLLAEEDERVERFNAWVAQFGKTYPTDAARATAFSVWTETDKHIAEHNAKDSSYTLGHNQFSDMTPEEFCARYTNRALALSEREWLEEKKKREAKERAEQQQRDDEELARLLAEEDERAERAWLEEKKKRAEQQQKADEELARSLAGSEDDERARFHAFSTGSMDRAH